MASPFNIKEIEKIKYCKPFYEIFESSNIFKLVNGKEFTFDKSSKDVLKLMDAFKNVDINTIKSLILDGKKYVEFDGFIDSKKTKVLFSKISKENVSKFKSNSTNSNIDDLRECGVCYFLDMLIQKSSFEKYNPGPKSKLEISTPYSDVKTYLTENPDWKDSCYKSALSVYKNVKTSGYTIHHKSKEFENLKSQGKKLTKLNPDKWNPADFFLIKDNYNIPTFKSYQELNSSINEFDKIIGISLKKSSDEALYGAFALNNLSNKYGFSNFRIINFSKFDENFKKFLKKELKELQSKSNILVRLQDINFDINYTKVSNSNVSNNFFKSVPYCVKFLNEFINNKHYDDILYEIVASCLSKLPQSSNFYKVMGSTFEKYENTPFSVKIDKIILSLNGETDIKMLITVDNHKYKLQLRSKGTLPQFMIVPISNILTTKDDYDIKKVKF